jgi:pimeloyl-ACP methyl ester carboxylesterase
MSHKYSNFQNNSTNVRNNYKTKLVRVTLSFFYTFFPVLIENFIKQHFFAPKSYPLSDQEKQLLDSGESFEISIHQQHIKGWKWGEGPYVILAHGWNGRGSQFILFIKNLIKTGLSVIVFDGPGHGQSAGKSSSYFQMTDAVRSLINYVGKENISGLLGHSFGSSAIINAISKENFNTKTVLLAPALNIKRILYDTFLSYGIPLGLFNDIIAKYEKKYGYNLEKDNPINLIKSIKNELLIIHDQDDAITPYQESQDVSEKNKTILLQTSQGLGHKRILTDQNIINWTMDYLKY